MMIDGFYPPDEPVTRKMTRLQIEMLRQIVRTNGGGISAFRLNGRVLQALVDRHMVQGKSGESYVAVHTKRGLDWCRANPVEASS